MATAQQDTETEAQDTTAYHWIMTVQAGARFNTRNAVVHVPRGFTRQQVFAFVLNQFQEDYSGALTVLYFDLQPNQL